MSPTPEHREAAAKLLSYIPSDTSTATGANSAREEIALFLASRDASLLEAKDMEIARLKEQSNAHRDAQIKAEAKLAEEKRNSDGWHDQYLELVDKISQAHHDPQVVEALKYADKVEDDVLNAYGLACKTLAAALRTSEADLIRAMDRLEYVLRECGCHINEADVHERCAMCDNVAATLATISTRSEHERD